VFFTLTGTRSAGDSLPANSANTVEVAA